MQVGRLTTIDLKLAKSILNNTLDITRRVRAFVGFSAGFSIGHDNSQNSLIFSECFCLLIQQELDLRICTALFHNICFHKRNILFVKTKITGSGVQNIAIFELLFGQRQGIEILSFNPNGIHTIFSVQKLNNLSPRSSNSTVVSSHDCFHRFHQTALNITGLCCFTGGIDQTLSTTHCVEEKFLRSQSTKVTIFNESTRLGSQIVL
mmetsp:Transcript_1170/g.2675  ORF Transcript_1170/g.2675 Transcript_1170/m.2675 type:complete len:206 (-) Transcript_1170:515-1132(-)